MHSFQGFRASESLPAPASAPAGRHTLCRQPSPPQTAGGSTPAVCRGAPPQTAGVHPRRLPGCIPADCRGAPPQTAGGVGSPKVDVREQFGCPPKSVACKMVPCHVYLCPTPRERPGQTRSKVVPWTGLSTDAVFGILCHFFKIPRRLQRRYLLHFPATSAPVHISPRAPSAPFFHHFLPKISQKCQQGGAGRCAGGAGQRMQAKQRRESIGPDKSSYVRAGRTWPICGAPSCHTLTGRGRPGPFVGPRPAIHRRASGQGKPAPFVHHPAIQVVGPRPAIHRRASGQGKPAPFVHHPAMQGVWNKIIRAPGRGKPGPIVGPYATPLEGVERELGAAHPHTLSSINNLAMVLENKGKFAEAGACTAAPGTFVLGVHACTCSSARAGSHVLASCGLRGPRSLVAPGCDTQSSIGPGGNLVHLWSPILPYTDDHRAGENLARSSFVMPRPAIPGIAGSGPTNEPGFPWPDARLSSHDTHAATFMHRPPHSRTSRDAHAPATTFMHRP
eukprot:gene24008-biopygen1312